MARIKLTRKVKRGLALMRDCMLEFASDDGRSWSMIVRKWRRSEENDFNAAMAWIEQCEADSARLLEMIGGPTCEAPQDKEHPEARVQSVL